MNIWHDIDEERIKKDDFLAVIEIPKGCKNKYELDKIEYYIQQLTIQPIMDLYQEHMQGIMILLMSLYFVKKKFIHLHWLSVILLGYLE